MFTVSGTPPTAPRLTPLEASPPKHLPADGACMISPEAKLPKLACLLTFRPQLPCAFLAWSDGLRIAVSGPSGEPENADEVPIGRTLDSKMPITALAACSGPRPWLLALAGSQAACWGISCGAADKSARSGVAVAKWTAHNGETWRTSAWHPSLDVAALASQRRVSVVCPEARQAPNASEELISTLRGGQVLVHLDTPEDGRIVAGRVSVAWADGKTLVLGWGTKLEIIRWKHKGDRSAASQSQAWGAGQYVRQEMILGAGAYVRALACEGGAAVVGTLDAPVALSPSITQISAGHSLISESLAATGVAGPNSQPAMAESGVLDLRGQFRLVETPEVTVPASFMLNSSPAAEARASTQALAQAARIVAFWPSECDWHTENPKEAGTHAQPNCVLPLALPMPDILRVRGSLVAVASSVGPPAVQLFSIQREGLEPIVTVALDHPNPSGQRPADSAITSRLQGLEIDLYPAAKRRSSNRARGSLRLWGLQAKRIVEDVTFISSTITASLTLAHHTVTLDGQFLRDEVVHDGPGDVPQLRRGSHEEVLPAAMQAPPSMTGQDHSDAQEIVSQLASMISALQVHLDSRLDKVEKSLEIHERRLSRIEGSVGSQAPSNTKH